MAVTAESLLQDELLPFYPPAARADLERARREDANPGKNPSIPAHLREAAGIFVLRAPQLFGRDLALDYSDASVHRLSAALTRELRDRLRDGAGGEPSTLFQLVVHGAAYVGECVVRGHGGAWEARQPLWESRVALESPAGQASLAVLSWWLHALSDAVLEGREGATLADRYRALVEVPTFDPKSLPPLVRERVDRRLPRLTRPTYSTFYKYLKAHLPELRDVGADFPSPERFDEMSFRWLEPLILGDGRLVLIFGPGKGGLHLFWMDAGGFAKSAFFPVEGTLDPIVRVKSELVLEVLLPEDGRTVAHELLYWGP